MASNSSTSHPPKKHNQLRRRRRRANLEYPPDETDSKGSFQHFEQQLFQPLYFFEWQQQYDGHLLLRDNENGFVRCHRPFHPVGSSYMGGSNNNAYCEENDLFRFPRYYTSSSENHLWLGEEQNQEVGGQTRIDWELVCCDSPQQQTGLDRFYAPASVYEQRVLASSNETTFTVSSSRVVQSAVAVQIVVSLVAVILNITIILGMTAPLLEKRKRTRASTYNLYLAFLSFPDLVYNVFLVYLFATYSQWVKPEEIGQINNLGDLPLLYHPWDTALFTACATANIYTDVIIAYEILKLLRNSKQRKRSRAPTLRTAVKQACCTYTGGVAVFCIDHFAGDFFKSLKTWVVVPLYYILVVGIPFLSLCWINWRMTREGLLSHNAKTGRRLKILVRYFFRIILVYVLIWFPATILYSLQWAGSVPSHGLFYYLACLLYAIQVWVAFALSMTKPDVRKNIYNLFVCRQGRRIWAARRGVPFVESDRRSTTDGRAVLNFYSASKQTKNESVSQNEGGSQNGGGDADPKTLATVQPIEEGSESDSDISDYNSDIDVSESNGDVDPDILRSWYIDESTEDIRGAAGPPPVSESLRKGKSTGYLLKTKKEGNNNRPRKQMSMAGMFASTKSLLSGLRRSNNRDNSDSSSRSHHYNSDDLVFDESAIIANSAPGMLPQIDASARSESDHELVQTEDPVETKIPSDPHIVAHNRWIKDLRKGIREMAKQLKEACTDEDKVLFHRSILHQRMALVSFRDPLMNTWKSMKSMNNIPEDAAAADDNDDDDDDDDSLSSNDSSHEDVGLHPSERMTKARWVEELEQNINDLDEKLRDSSTKDEQTTLRRSIIVQRNTLARIVSLDENDSVFMLEESSMELNIEPIVKSTTGLLNFSSNDAIIFLDTEDSVGKMPR